jgi:hypothetical protein
VLYAAVVVAWTWPLATLVGTHTALPAGVRKSLALNDQAFSISAAARNADAITSGDLRRLVDWRLCYPTPHAAALGEHAIELGAHRDERERDVAVIEAANARARLRCAVEQLVEVRWRGCDVRALAAPQAELPPQRRAGIAGDGTHPTRAPGR